MPVQVREVQCITTVREGKVAELVNVVVLITAAIKVVGEYMHLIYNYLHIEVVTIFDN